MVTAIIFSLMALTSFAFSSENGTDLILETNVDFYGQSLAQPYGAQQSSNSLPSYSSSSGSGYGLGSGFKTGTGYGTNSGLDSGRPASYGYGQGAGYGGYGQNFGLGGGQSLSGSGFNGYGGGSQALLPHTGYGTGGYGDPMIANFNTKVCTTRTVDQTGCTLDYPDRDLQWRYINNVGWRKFTGVGAARKDWWDYKHTFNWPFHYVGPWQW